MQKQTFSKTVFSQKITPKITRKIIRVQIKKGWFNTESKTYINFEIK